MGFPKQQNLALIISIVWISPFVEEQSVFVLPYFSTTTNVLVAFFLMTTISKNVLTAMASFFFSIKSSWQINLEIIVYRNLCFVHFCSTLTVALGSPKQQSLALIISTVQIWIDIILQNWCHVKCMNKYKLNFNHNYIMLRHIALWIHFVQHLSLQTEETRINEHQTAVNYQRFLISTLTLLAMVVSLTSAVFRVCVSP